MILTVTSSAVADQKIKGHMTPLPSEQLAQPIYINECGLRIREWRGTEMNTKRLSRVKELCALTMRKFYPFAQLMGLQIRNESKFSFDIAFIPDTSGYRGINDTQYRFFYRNSKNVWGYTSKTNQFIFTISNVMISEMSLILPHEMFHALSMHHGIFDAHSGDDAEKIKIDEQYALAFEKYVRQ